jgi:hypothetical protein
MEVIMSSIKAQAIEMIQNIPDEKVLSIIDILKGLQLLYDKNQGSIINEPAASAAMGIFGKYADVSLVPLEKEAWGEAAKEKHAVN